MDKIVGKISIFFLLLLSVVIEGRISLEVRTEAGISNQVVIGQPFTLDVVIEDVYGSVPAPTIAGLEKFISKRTGMYMSSINGKSTTRYSYQVRIDTIGSYTIGPAMVVYEKNSLVSNDVQINVVKDAGFGAANNKQGKAEGKVFLRLMVDAESVVVGQKIGCTLRFYYQDSSLTLHNIGMPELPGFDIQEIGKLESGMADINGSQYRYAQWKWDMYPKKSGEFIIPAYNADYEIPVKDNNVLGGLFIFMNNRSERKRVYSNAITIKVAPLPHHNGRVDAIGSFERIVASINPSMAKEGEGMVLALEIEGTGNLNAIAVPKLRMPEALKYYDSNNAVVAASHSDELPKKRFEFIVQGMQTGDWEIPEQLFTYFDIEKNNYVTLRTSPLTVSIMPGVFSATKESDIIAPVEAVTVQVITDIDDNIEYINVVGPWNASAESQSLPWWIFQLLFLMPCLYVFCPLIVNHIIVLTGNSVRFSKRRIFKHARKQIEQSIASGDGKNLYTVFTDLFAQLDRILLLHDGETVLRMNRLHHECSMSWNDFFERITHVAYAQADDKDIDELCRMAKQWIDRLEKIM